MPKKDSAQILRNMKEIGSAFGKKATELTNVIRVVETTLQEMEGKVEGREEIDEHRVVVFGRLDSGWGLWVENVVNDKGFYRLNQVNIETKALIGKALPRLVEQIVSTAEKRLSMVNGALEALEDIPWLDVEEASQDDGVPF